MVMYINLFIFFHKAFYYDDLFANNNMNEMELNLRYIIPYTGIQFCG